MNTRIGSAGIQAMSPREWALLVCLSILWGGSFFFIGVAVKHLPPLVIVFMRVVIAASALALIGRMLRIGLPTNKDALISYLGMGILNNVIPFSLIVWAQGYIASGLASILNATTPLFTIAVLHVFSVDEKATAQKFLGVMIGFAGVALMIGFDLLAFGNATLLPQLAMLGATLSYAFSGLWGRRFARLGIKPIAAATGQLTASGLLLLPLVMIVDAPWRLSAPPMEVWLAVIALALASTSLAYLIFFRILASAGATNLAMVTFLIPVSAICLGVLFLGETLAFRHFGGMTLIGIGLALIDGRAIHLFQRENADG